MAPHSSQKSTEKPIEPPKETLETKKAYTIPGRPYALYSSLPYYFVHATMLSTYLAIVYLNNPFWILIVLFLGVPLVDWLSHDWLNPDQKQYKELENSVWFRIPLYLQIVLDNILFFKSIHILTYGGHPVIFQIGTVLLMGTIAGHNFLIAHEIYHKRGLFYRTLGTLVILKNLYMHYTIEHHYGHHKNVATPGDPSTSQYGESLYQFLRRAIPSSYMSAWNIEKKRLTTLFGHKTHWVVENKMIWFTLSYFLFPMIIYKMFGSRFTLFYFIMTVFSVITLETINYVEHYGLQRKEIAPGEYERVDVTHSWNAPQRFSNYFLFKLQRHSDHHENAYKPYHVLVSKDESPMLPHGYMWCLIVAFIPPLWFRTMDKVLLAYKEKRSLTKDEKYMINKDSLIMYVSMVVLFGVLLVVNHNAVQK